MYGPPTLLQYVPNTAKVQSVEDSFLDRDKANKLLHDHLIAARDRMKYYADRGRTERQFTIGDWVLLKLQSYRQVLVHGHLPQKLAAKYYGPYQVVAAVGRVAYKLKLPEEPEFTTCSMSHSLRNTMVRWRRFAMRFLSCGSKQRRSQRRY